MRSERGDVLRWAGDAASALESLLDEDLGVPVTWIGHSLGGQLLPFARHDLLARALMVATGTGYWRLNPPSIRWRAPLFLRVVAPLAMRWSGYYPGRRLGLLGDAPSSAMRQWARWCLSPDYYGVDVPDLAAPPGRAQPADRDRLVHRRRAAQRPEPPGTGGAVRRRAGGGAPAGALGPRGRPDRSPRLLPRADAAGMGLGRPAPSGDPVDLSGLTHIVRPDGAPPPPRPAHRPARRRPRRPAVDAAGRTRSRSRSSCVVPAQGRRALADPAALAPARDVGAQGGDGVCAGVEFRFPRSLVAELTGTAGRRPLGPRRAWPGRCCGARRLAGRALGGHARGPPRPPRHRRRGRVPARPPLRGRAPAGRAVRVVRRPAPAAARRLVGRARHRRRSVASSTTTWPGSRRCGGPSPRRSTPRPRRARHAATVARLETGAGRPAAADLAVRPHPDAGHRDRAAARARRATTTCTCGCPHPSDDLWQRLADLAGPVAAPRRRQPPAGPAPPARLARPRPARAPAQPRRRPGTTPRSPHPARADHPARLAAVRPARRRRATARAGASTGTTALSRCTAATDRPARCRCCARCCSACSRTTRRLEPRDILVMCPDIENYAPLITAAFGLGDVVEGGHPAHRLRVQLADRALSSTNPLLGVAAHLLDVAGSRATASEVLDLAQSPPVRRRFGFGDDDLDSIADWVRESGVRWGFDADHRQPFGVRYLQNTWRFGLDRVLAGVAMSDDSQAWLGTRAARSTTSAATGSSSPAGSPSTSTGWSPPPTGSPAPDPRPTGSTALADGVADADPGRPRRRSGRSARCSASSPGSRSTPASAPPARCGCTDVRAMLGDHLAGRPTRANFRAGSLTVCTMVPMRSVPHRVVCLLGLDDGVFPRQRTVDGDDVLARTPGDRRARRPLARTASCSSTRSAPPPRRSWSPTPAPTRTAARTGRPPYRSVSCSTPSTAPPRRRSATRSWCGTRSSPSTSATSSPGRLGTPDAVHLRPADARPRRRRRPDRGPTPPPFLAAPAGRAGRRARPTTTSPSPTWSPSSRTRSRASSAPSTLTLPWDVDGVSDAMPVEIDQLETWGVGDRMLDDMLRGIHPDTAREIEWRRGALPPGQLGWRKATEVRETAMNLAVAALDPPPGRRPQAHDVDVDAPRRAPAHRHRHPGLRRPARRRRLLQARRQAPARVVGAAAGPRRRRTPTTTGPP